MSTPSPRPQSLVLDAHTEQFFDPAFWSGKAQAKFCLDLHSLTNKIFLGRIALYCDGNYQLVLCEETNESAPVLVVLLRLPHQHSTPTISQVTHFFQTHLTMATENAEKRGDEVIPVLRGPGLMGALLRLHFDARTGMGWPFTPEVTRLW